MKKMIRRNQVIITSLAILIAVAGYLNFSDVEFGRKEQEASAGAGSILDELEFDLSDETALLEENGLTDGSDSLTLSDSPGEAVLTSSTNFAAQAKLSREQIRSQNKADLQSIIENADLSDDAKQGAIRSIVEMTEISEKEAAAELLLEAKGFENVIVNMTGETADVVVPKAYLEDSARAQIEDIVKRKTGIVESNIVITSLANSSVEIDTENAAENAASSEIAEDAELYDEIDSLLGYEDDASYYEDDYTYLTEADETSANGYEIMTDGIYD